MARVSVIVAARDEAGRLAGTLASVQAQTYEDWEVVVVDDGSVDGTADVAAALGERVRVLRHERAQGPAAARNLAARTATGELLAPLDADDAWDPGYLAHQVAMHDRARAERRRIGLVACDARLVGAAGELALTFAQRVGRPAAIDLRLMAGHNMLLTPTVVCRRDAFLEVGGFDARLGRAEDYDLWLRLLEAGYEALVSDDALVVVQLRSDGLSSDTAALATATARACELALARGRLDRRCRRAARRQRRLQRLVARRARIAETHAAGRSSLVARLRVAPATALVALEHPERWRHWLRHGPRTPGPGRHA